MSYGFIYRKPLGRGKILGFLVNDQVLRIEDSSDPYGVQRVRLNVSEARALRDWLNEVLP